MRHTVKGTLSNKRSKRRNVAVGFRDDQIDSINSMAAELDISFAEAVRRLIDLARAMLAGASTFRRGALRMTPQTHISTPAVLPGRRLRGPRSSSRRPAPFPFMARRRRGLFVGGV